MRCLRLECMIDCKDYWLTARTIDWLQGLLTVYHFCVLFLCFDCCAWLQYLRFGDFIPTHTYGEQIIIYTACLRNPVWISPTTLCDFGDSGVVLFVPSSGWIDDICAEKCLKMTCWIDCHWKPFLAQLLSRSRRFTSTKQPLLIAAEDNAPTSYTRLSSEGD